MPLNNTATTSRPILKSFRVFKGILDYLWVLFITNLPASQQELMTMMMMMMTMSMKILAKEASVPVNIPTLGQGSLH